MTATNSNQPQPGEDRVAFLQRRLTRRNAIKYGAAGTAATVAAMYASPSIRTVHAQSAGSGATPTPGGEVCEGQVRWMLLRYQGPAIVSATVNASSSTGTFSYDFDVFGPGTLNPGTDILFNQPSSYSGTGNDDERYGPRVLITVSPGSEEEIHTSCSKPFIRGDFAPLDDSDGFSSTWQIIDFASGSGGAYPN